MSPTPRLIFLLFAIIGTLASLSASERVGTVTARLCEHVKQRKTMLVDKSQPDLIWSDGAMFEIARTFPSELQAMIANPTGTRDLRLIWNRMSGKPEDGWQDAKAPRSARSQGAISEYCATERSTCAPEN